MKNHSPFGRFLTAVTFILIVILLSRTPADADMWWHLKAGQVMWEQKSILVHDVFSYTRFGTLWVNAFWLSDLILYGCYALDGYFALAMFVALSGGLAFLLVSRRMSSNLFSKSGALLLAAMTAAPIWGPRPQIFSFLIVAWLDAWLTQKPLSKWILPLLFALWANLHGGWIWGILLLIAHISGLFVQALFSSAEEKNSLLPEVLRLTMWTLISVFFIGLNPNGLALWKLPFQQIDVSLQIQEWLSPDFHRIDFHPMLWMLFALFVTAPFAPKPIPWPQIFKVIGFAYMTFVAQRNIALFAITAAPLLAEWGNAFLQSIHTRIPTVLTQSKELRRARLFNAVILLTLGFSALFNLVQISQAEKVDGNYPVGAIEWLKDNRPPGRLFNSYNWGGYLIWTLPEYPVFIDGRADLYGNDLIQQWHDVVNARSNAFDSLDAWNVNIVLLEPDRPIIEALKKSGWKMAYEDKKAVILIRQ